MMKALLSVTFHSSLQRAAEQVCCQHLCDWSQCVRDCFDQQSFGMLHELITTTHTHRHKGLMSNTYGVANALRKCTARPQ